MENKNRKIKTNKVKELESKNIKLRKLLKEQDDYIEFLEEMLCFAIIDR